MKKTNKGFSLVELIIVIAIMAILAGALAPALIKYINKSRASAAISNGQQIASAIQTALSNESIFDSTTDVANTTYASFVAGSSALSKEVVKTLGATTKHKAKKTLQGHSAGSQDYFVEVHPVPSSTQNMVSVFVGTNSADYMVYPTMGKEWKD